MKDFKKLPKICTDCGATYPPKKNKCDHCGGFLQYETEPRERKRKAADEETDATRRAIILKNVRQAEELLSRAAEHLRRANEKAANSADGYNKHRALLSFPEKDLEALRYTLSRYSKCARSYNQRYKIH
jgi:predicted  nucleic acid-binding Zn-ribbon protein